MTLTFVYGCRPEARKILPVLTALRGQGVPLTILFTGQHPDLARFTTTLPAFAGQVDLGTPNLGADPFDYARALAADLVPHLGSGPVVVQGDTATAYAGALAADLLDLPLYHIEAGVRTHHSEDPWPEEQFRVGIDRLADAGCCATPGNQLALEREGKAVARFPVTGNPGIDALLAEQSPVTHRWDHLLVTLHRRESFGPRLAAFVQALCDWARRHPSVPVFWPVHPNPAVREALGTVSGLPASLVLLPPLESAAFLPLLAHAHAVLTDSGGVQEEAAALGVPAVIARQVTDRPESVQQGLALLCPRPEDLPEALAAAWRGALRAVPSPTFGDGLAAPLITQHLTALYL